jgi:hypothetical protein
MPYSIEMHFDADSEAKIRSIWDKMLHSGLPSSLIQDICKPHLSLVVYDRLDPASAGRLMSDISSCIKRFPLKFGFIGAFTSPENVIFLGPVLDDPLFSVHKCVNGKFSEYESQAWPCYLPNAWQPHCTVAMKIPDDKFIECYALIHESFQPFEAMVVSIALAEFPPLKFLREIALE